MCCGRVQAPAPAPALRGSPQACNGSDIPEGEVNKIKQIVLFAQTSTPVKIWGSWLQVHASTCGRGGSTVEGRQCLQLAGRVYLWCTVSTVPG